ncbi:DUF4349 domain-containing protein [Caenorhabditis elegans]|uniref:DUF4349 domain-containing protein n=1 Tax=Caenorhabditis elegans TaxID=6239 RepID=Q9U2C8_CAEEL|nr:DUF4349 domain-containing protein [Caenorhabditis elegans]CAB57893.1 DUF4349 domain-containing protein [Caenorhabditis elegans]|eukprot:NP_499443.1 Uncharacterized protein CELE_Y47D3A.13 [Caenorhabditis elegans]
MLVLQLSIVNCQLVPSERHNQKIAEQINDYNNDPHIIKAEISAPDVVVNKYTLQDKNISAALKKHVAEAAAHFATMTDADRDAAVVQLPNANHTGNGGGGKGKRSSGMKIDVEGTKNLHKQALEFLDKYDVELHVE